VFHIYLPTLMMHGQTQIKFTTGMSHLKVINASRGSIHKYKNLKRKLHNCNVNIYFNQQCLKMSYTHVNEISSLLTSTPHIYVALPHTGNSTTWWWPIEAETCSCILLCNPPTHSKINFSCVLTAFYHLLTICKLHYMYTTLDTTACKTCHLHTVSKLNVNSSL
jgi:hypothetical protein